MKTKFFKRMLAISIATTMVLTACGQKPTSGTSEKQITSESKAIEKTESEKPVNKKDLPVLTLYPKDSNLFSGLVTGFRSDYFAENGGFQLEVWAYSDDKTNAILTSGDLPDMMYIPYNSENLVTLINNDKIINYDDYTEYLPNIFGDNPTTEYYDENIEVIREVASAGTGNLYVLPVDIGDFIAKYNQTGTFDRNVVKLKWDVYEAIGTPEIKDLWQLLDVVEDMLEYQPTAEDGSKMYGTFLDNGIDTERFGCMYLWYQWHGYNVESHAHFVELDNVNGTYKSIFDEDSLYKEGVRWYNEMYRRGLMDPDSISTSRTDQMAKVSNGLAMMPSGTAPGWEPYYYEVFVPGLNVYKDFTTETFDMLDTSIVINKDSEHIEECLKFINMLYDPYDWLNIDYGPEGVIWQEENNVLSITDEFAKWLEENGSISGFPMGDGTTYNTWNTRIGINRGVTISGYTDINGDPVPPVPTSWPDAQKITTNNETWNTWKETMNAESLWDYCAKNNITVYTSSVFDGITLPLPNDNQALTISTIKDVVVPATWNMVYAETEEEFEKLWDKMIEDVNGLGAKEIVEWKLKCYEDALKK